MGYEESGGLTEKIRKKPYSVVLFDEIEKAHNDVLNLLLQILEDGILTDSQGRVANFKNTIIIMTSNIGAKILLSNKKIGFDFGNEKMASENIKQSVMTEVKNYFKPEFINRIDEIIIFEKLTKKELFEITKIMLNDLKERLEKNNIIIEFEENVVQKIVDDIRDENYGARPIRKNIKKYIEDELTNFILENPNVPKMRCEVKEEKIVIVNI